MLSLTRTDKEEIGRVLTYANRNKLTPERVTAIFAGKVRPVGDDPGHVCQLRAGKRHYRVVFSYEQQPIGWMRHLSVSSSDHKTITVEDVNCIMRAFRFRWRDLPNLSGEETSYGAVRTWWEGPGLIHGDRAFNVVEVVDDEAARKVVEEGGLKVAQRLSRSAIVIREPQPEPAT